ncbi:MAG: TlpA family protein disulfide reductase [Planctomycetia bacterium]|nr:TlpA family protein disulfide reductase [Planctomycetia bacterium]
MRSTTWLDAAVRHCRAFACLIAVCLAAGVARAADQAAQAAPAAQPSGVTLHLANGDFSAGELVDSRQPDAIAWQAKGFTAPFRFALPSVSAVHFPVPEPLPLPEGEYCFELAGGDVLFGSLVALAGDEAVLEVAGLGTLHVERATICRMHRWKADDLVYSGPSGLTGWQPSGAFRWREEGGHLVTEGHGMVLRRDLGIPPLARLDIELSWQNKPDFDMAFGIGAEPKSILRAFHIEVWEKKLVVWRETEREADVAALMQVDDSKAGRVHLQAFLDQEKGRMLVFSAGGEQLADLQVATAKPQPAGGFSITNKYGDVGLERLRIGRWNGEAPLSVDLNKARIHGTDGTITYGRLASYDPATREFVIEEGAEQRRVDATSVRDVFVSQEAAAVPRSLRAVHLDGRRISGQLIKVEGGKVWIKCPGIREPLASPIQTLHSLAVMERATSTPKLAGREGRLEIDGVRLRGCLVEGHEGDATCLVWQPQSSAAASALSRGVSGRIVYRDPPPPPAAAATQAQQRRGVVGRVVVAPAAAPVAPPAAGVFAQIQRLVGGAPAAAAPQPPKRKEQAVLHLRSGDTVPCTATGIDEKGVTFVTAITDATFIRHEDLKVLELMPEAQPAKIAKNKKERLLTLPRMQRDNPPLQLIRSVDGDYLRGRLIEMNDKELQVEVRLETKTVPRESIARIIWLHPDELAGDAARAASKDSAATRVQALQGDGKRLTFVAQEFAGATLSGRSELLGACRVDVGQIDELLIGTAIEKSAATLAFHQWKLKPAAEPLVANDGGDGGGEGSEGLESALVNKPAPDFDLNLLDEKKRFRLSDHKDSVVVLDFWASWCGPCLQVMPQVDRVAREFADQGVKLVAINLEETPDKVKAALERLQLDMTVALDRDGRVAEKYGATSIPQTVIVGRDGKVARLFVGGSARFDEQLRAALQSVLSGGKEKEGEGSN